MKGAYRSKMTKEQIAYRLERVELALAIARATIDGDTSFNEVQWKVAEIASDESFDMPPKQKVRKGRR